MPITKPQQRGHFHCLKKGTTKCKAKCTIAVHENEDEKVFELENVDQIRDHNHSVHVADIIASDMNNDMHKVMSKDLTAKPSVVRKKVMRESITIKLHSVLQKSQRNLYLTYSATLVRAKRATRMRGGLPPRYSSF